MITLKKNEVSLIRKAVRNRMNKVIDSSYSDRYDIEHLNEVLSSYQVILDMLDCECRDFSMLLSDLIIVRLCLSDYLSQIAISMALERYSSRDFFSITEIRCVLDKLDELTDTAVIQLRKVSEG